MIWVLLSLCGLGFVLLKRVPVCPHIATGAVPSPALKISVLIPVRNEEHNIRRLLESLFETTLPPHEVIVVDDGSTDRTAAVARGCGAKVITAPPLPDGWRGKTWACWNGAAAATGDALLFLDADTIVKRAAFERIGAAWRQGYCKVLSLGPYHDIEKPYEELSGIFNLLTFMGMGSFSVFGSPNRPDRLFGPFLLIDREVYDAIGGHESVKGEILEHMSMGRLLRSRDISMQCLGGRGVVHTRMYPDGLRTLIEGWTKAFAEGAAKTHPMILLLTIVWITGAMTAFVHFAISPFIASATVSSGLVYVAYGVSLFWMLRQIGRFSFWSSLLYPILLVTFFAIFGRSLFLRQTGGRVTWKARSIDVSRREES